MGAGQRFQAQAAAWWAMRILLRTPVEQMYALPAQSIPERISCETADPVDDLRIDLSSDATLYFQCKRSLSLSDSPKSDWASVITDCHAELSRPHRPEAKRHFVVMYGAQNGALETLRGILERYRGIADGEPFALAALNAEEHKIIAKIDTLFDALEALDAYKGISAQKEAILRSLFLMRLQFDPGEPDHTWTVDAARHGLLKDPGQAQQMINTLIRFMSDLIAKRGSASVDALRQELLTSGIQLQGTVDYREDLKRLSALTDTEIHTQEVQGRMEIAVAGKKVLIEREVSEAMYLLAQCASFLVIGGAGCGKTGCMLALAKKLKDSGKRVLYWPADSLQHSSAQEIASVLQLQNTWQELFSELGSDAYLIIDGLDALRDTASQNAYKQLMTLAADAGIHVIASMRSFDLRYSASFRDAFPRHQDMPPAFAHPMFPNVNHICIPELSDAEFQQAVTQLPEIKGVLDSTPTLKPIVKNLFSLDLLCKLINDGVTATELSAISTQAELFESFWDHRIRLDPAQAVELEKALTEVVERMVTERKLQIPIGEQAGEVRRTLLSTEILRHPPAPAGYLPSDDLIEFQHHLLFDYAAELLFVRKRKRSLTAELAGDDTWGLFLRPSLVLFHRHLWANGRAEFWDTLTLLQTEQVPHIQRIPAYLIIAEEARSSTDLEPLLVKGENSDPVPIQGVVSAFEFSSAVRLFSTGSGEWWLEFANQLIGTGNKNLIHLGRRILHSAAEHIEKLSKTGKDLLNKAAIALFNFYSAQGYNSAASTTPLKWICKTIESDIEASLEAISRATDTAKMKVVGYQAGFEVSFYIENIWKIRPAFVTEFYKKIFAHTETDDSPSQPMGGQILSIVSNKRQDFDGIAHCLSEKFPEFLEDAPPEGTRALATVIASRYERKERWGETPEIITLQWEKDAPKFLLDNCYIWDDGSFPDEEERMLQDWENFLATKLPLREDAEGTWMAIKVALIQENSCAALWRRLLSAASESPDFFAAKISELLLNTPLLLESETELEARHCIAAFSSILGDPWLSDLQSLVLGINESHFPHTDDKEFLERHIKEKKARLLFAIPANLRNQAATDFLTASGLEEKKLAAKLSRSQMTSEVSMATEEEMFAHQGIDVTNTPSQSLLDASRFLRDLSSQGITNENLDELLTKISTLSKDIDAAGDTINPRLAATLRVRVTNGKAKIASSKVNLEPEVQNEFYKHFEAVLSEPTRADPESIAHFEGDVFSADERTHATEGIVSLIQRKPHIEAHDRTLLQALSKDTDPRVRFYLGRLIWRFFEKWPEFIWDTLERWISEIHTNNGSPGVLRGTLHNGWFWPLWKSDETRAAALIRKLRHEASSLKKDDLRQMVGDWLGILWFRKEQEWCHTLLQEDIKELPEHIDELEGAEYTALELIMPRNAGTTSDEDQRKRALAFLIELINQSHHILTTSQEEINAMPPEKRPKELLPWVRQLANLVHHASRHFHSAANDFVKKYQQASADKKKVMLEDWWKIAEPLLDSILQAKHPSIAFDIIKGLEGLVDLDVERTLHWLAKVTEANSAVGLTNEQLAADHTIEVLERILAEHKASLKEGSQLRKDFLSILDAYLAVGWDRAMRLALQIESIFR